MAKFVDKIELGAGSAGEFSKCLYEILLAGKRSQAQILRFCRQYMAFI
jgi:hypothetical protein